MSRHQLADLNLGGNLYGMEPYGVGLCSVEPVPSTF